MVIVPARKEQRLKAARFEVSRSLTIEQPSAVFLLTIWERYAFNVC